MFWQTVPAQYLPLVLWLEADRMATLRIDEEAFKREREVVKEERRMRIENQPYGRLNEIIYDHAFTTHPYKHPTIGSMADLEAASIDDVRDFHRTFYVPDNATVTLVGDFDSAQALQMVNQYFGRVPKARGRCRATFRRSRRRRRSAGRVEESWPLPAVVVAHHVTYDGHPDAYPLHIASKILSDGQSSRISAQAGLQQAAGADGVRQRQHHRGSEPVLRGGDRAAGADAGGSGEGADRGVREAEDASRSARTSCSGRRTSGRATTSSAASRTRTRRCTWRTPPSSTTTSRRRTASSTSS